MSNHDKPDMDISIILNKKHWTAQVYYPGFNKESEVIAQDESYIVVVEKVITFLKEKVS